MSTYEDQIFNLRTAEFAADGDECVRRDDAARIARAADAEIAKLRAENERRAKATRHNGGNAERKATWITII